MKTAAQGAAGKKILPAPDPPHPLQLQSLFQSQTAARCTRFPFKPLQFREETKQSPPKNKERVSGWSVPLTSSFSCSLQLLLILFLHLGFFSRLILQTIIAAGSTVVFLIPSFVTPLRELIFGKTLLAAYAQPLPVLANACCAETLQWLHPCAS